MIQVPARPAPVGGRWSAADLRYHLGEHRISMAVLQAAMLDANRSGFASPEEALQVVEAFLKKPIAETYP